MNGRFSVSFGLGDLASDATVVHLILPGIGEAEWTFKCAFSAEDSILSASYVDLVFDGLDTYCTVELVRVYSIFRSVLLPCSRLYRTERRFLSTSESYICVLFSSHSPGRITPSSRIEFLQRIS